MSLADLLPKLESLPRAEKVRLVHLLVEDLTREDRTTLTAAEYPIWTPVNAFGAADTLLRALEAESTSA